MNTQNYIEINSSHWSKFIHDYLPAILLWVLIISMTMIFSKSQGGNHRVILGILSFSTLPVILYYSFIQSKSYKLDSGGLTISTRKSSSTIAWENISSIAKVGKNDALVYELLDKNGHKYTFPLDSQINRTESFLDSLPQLEIVPTINVFSNNSCRWKNITEREYKYTSLADRFMNFSYGDPNSK